MPNNLRAGLLRHFIDIRLNTVREGTFVKLDVAVAQLLGVSPKIRVIRGSVVELHRRSLRRFIDLKDRDGAV